MKASCDPIRNGTYLLFGKSEPPITAATWIRAHGSTCWSTSLDRDSYCRTASFAQQSAARQLRTHIRTAPCVRPDVYRSIWPPSPLKAPCQLKATPTEGTEGNTHTHTHTRPANQPSCAATTPLTQRVFELENHANHSGWSIDLKQTLPSNARAGRRKAHQHPMPANQTGRPRWSRTVPADQVDRPRWSRTLTVRAA